MSDLISEAISNSNDDDIAAQGLHTANAIAEFYSDKVRVTSILPFLSQ